MLGLIATAVGAAIGGTLSVIDNQRSTDHQLSEYEQSLKDLTDAYNLNVENAKLQYEQAKDEAYKNAARSDAKSTFNEGNVATDANLSIEQLQLQQDAEGLAWNQQMQSNDQSTGDALSTMAASGTRSSSVQDAVDMQAAQNSAQLQIAEDQQRNSDNLQLANVLAGLGNNVFDIQTDRTAAQDLRDSYADGGYNQQIYENQLAQMAQSYNSQYGQIERAKDWAEENQVWNGIASFFSGAAQGASMGSNLGNLVSNLKAPSLSTSLGSNSTLSFSNLTSGNGSSAWDNISVGNYYFGNLSNKKWNTSIF